MFRYGLEFADNTSDLDIEFYCLRHDRRADHERGRLSSFEHYRNAVDIIFNGPDSIRRHIWSDESIRMSTEFLGDRSDKMFLSVAGNSSSGKSDDLGLFTIVIYLSNPAETLCLLTSTTLEMAKLRVWKAVREYWSQVERYFKSQGLKNPGEAVHSKGRIRGMDLNGDYSDACGLVLVAADKQKGEEATSKVMGAKAPGQGLLILGADELPDLSANILTVAFTNLVNNPQFWMYGLGNPNLKLDPHGRFSEPKDGWDSVSHKPLEWRTERGKCIRIDAESSSRIREEDSWTPEERRTKKTKFFWQPSREVIEAAARQYGRTSRFFGRMYDAMWTDSKAPNALYSENELMRAFREDPPDWDNPQSLVAVSGLDCSFTSGGDLSVSVEGLCGKVDGYDHFHVTSVTVYEIDPKLDLAPGHQIAQGWKRHCQQNGIRPRAAGFDSSGAGISFVSIVEMEWSTDVHKINFGSSPSGRIHRIDGVTTDEFANRVSELWIQPKEYLRGAIDEDGVRRSQITGLTPEIIEELVSRQYAEGWEGAKLKIEAKKKMKGRIGRSPDRSDAFVLALEVAVINGWLASAEEKQIIRKTNQRWTQTIKRRKLKLRTRGGMGKTLKY